MSILSRAVGWLLRLRTLLLLLSVATVVLAIGPSRRLQFDRSIESMFRQDDPRYENYNQAKRLFGGLETCVVAYDDTELFTVAGLQRLERLRNQLQALPGVRNVFCLANARRPSKPFDSRPLTAQLAAGAVTPESLRNEFTGSNLYRGRLVSADGRTAVLLVELSPRTGDDPAADRSATIARIREIGDQQQPPAVLSGGPVLVNDVFTHLEEDGVTLGVASGLILTLVIAVLFRNLRWIVLPLLVVQVTLVWTKALLATSGMQLSMVSSPLVALVTVIGVATVVHVTIRFREERRDAEPRAALHNTFLHVVPAIFWTCLTTAAGFAALLASSVSPVQSFGIMMALGSALVFVATFSLAPSVVLALPLLPTDPQRAPGEAKMTAALQHIVRGVERYPWRVGVAFVASVGVASLGIFRLEVATDFTENFRQSSPIVQAYHFLAERMDAVNTLDVLVDMPEPFSKEFEAAIARLQSLQEQLEREPAITDTLSLADLIDVVDLPTTATAGAAGETENGGGLLGWLPKLPGIGRQAKLVVLDMFEPAVVAGFWNREAGVARIVVQARHVQGVEAKKRLVERIETISREQFPSARTAGIYVLLTYVVESLLADQWTTFAISLASIFLMMTIAFRSWRLGLAALIPNAAPIIMVIGTMGWLGLKINMATAMLSSVSMGLAVDFSIHYLYRFQHELQHGHDFYAALHAAHGSVGLAMVLSNLALIAGFLVLVISALIPTVHFGILVSVAMLGGLAGNLIVLPLILRLLWRMGSFDRYGGRPGLSQIDPSPSS